MSPDPSTSPTIICPTCGTRNAEGASKCLVCGTILTTTAQAKKNPEKGVQGSRMPEITLSLPVAMIALALILGLGAGAVFYVLRSTGRVVEPTPTVTITPTMTATLTPTPVTPIPTETPMPSPTPFTYQVVTNDTCIGIAVAFGVSVNSIVLLNNLPADCSSLFEGQPLLIPQPTPTITPQPTATLSGAEATEQACEKATYMVQDNDTPGKIAADYGVPWEVIRSYNGLTSDIVYAGLPLTIPLCERAPTPGPSPTATPPPPYSAPNLLLPADGTAFAVTETTISLQWAAVGTLNPNELYVVTIVDITSGENQRLVDYVSDTKYNAPRSLRPTDGNPHIFRWTVGSVRQVGTDDSGDPIYEAAGATSNPRVFSWAGSGGPEVTPTP